MGVDYTAVAGIGILFDCQRQIGTTVVQSCQHEERLGQKFCPVCGARVSEKTEPVYDEDLEDELAEVTPPKGYIAEATTDGTSIFVGWGSMVSDYDCDDDVELIGVAPSQDEIKRVICEIFAQAMPLERAVDIVAENIKTFGFYHFMAAH